MRGSARLMRKPTTTSGAIRGGHARDQPAEVRDAELAIAVGEGHELIAGRPEARAQRRTVALVHRVVDGPDDARMRSREFVGDGRRPVAGAVVDGDDLERVGEAGQDGEGFLDEALQVGLLVVGGEEVRQARDARGRGGRRVDRGLGRPARSGRSCRAVPLGDDVLHDPAVGADERFEHVAVRESLRSRVGPRG